MPAVNKIDSNFTGGTRYAEEATIGVLPGSPVWKGLEINSFSGFSGKLALMARRPISENRRAKKGDVVDIDGAGGFNLDLVQNGLQDILQGVFFADLRRKAEFGDGSGVITAVDGSAETYGAASGLDVFRAGDLVFATGFGTVANNGLKRVTTASATAPVVAENITTEASPPAAAKLTQVGFQFASGDATMTVSGAFPVLGTTAKNCTQLGLVPGEWIYIGGDTSSLAFATAACNGFARVRSVTASAITLDKTQFTAVTDNGSGKTVQIFFGRVLKDESGANIVRRTYNIERKLGIPDTDNPSSYQSEYLVGAVANTMKLNVTQASKATVDIEFMGIDFEKRTAATGLKSGSRPAIVSEDAFNTSSDFARIKMARVSTTTGAPSALFAYVTDLNFAVSNNVSPDKAVGLLGAFEMTAGLFDVTGGCTAYFCDVAAVEAVRDNADVTIDAILVKNNAGMVIDIPLLALGNGQIDVVQDQAVKVPLEMVAGDAAAVYSGFDHVCLMSFFDYLPDAAE